MVGESKIEGVWVPNNLQEGGGGVGGAYLVPVHSHPFPHLFLYSLHSLPSLLHPIIPQERLCASHVHFALWLSDEQEKRSDLHNFNSTYLCQPRSIVHRPPKIVNILLWILLISSNISIFLFREITICNSRNPAMSFQSC